MKKLNLLLICCLTLMMGLFSSCEKDENVAQIVTEGNALIANYGSYDKVKGEISLFNEKTGAITNNYYSLRNATPFTSSIQSITKHNGNIYFMSNASDKIDVVNLFDFKAKASILTDITKPRYMAANGNKAYVSCWGDVSDWNIMANSYIAIINLDNKSVKKVAIAGGLEGMAIIGDKLYAASYTKKEVIVMDLNTEKLLSPIAIPALARHFLVNGNKLWVSHVSSYSINVDAAFLGISCINTSNNTIEKTINITSIGGNGYMAANKDFSKIYVLGNKYNADYTTSSNVVLVDGIKAEVENDKFITGASFYGMAYNQTTDNLYILVSPSSSTNGSVKIFNTKAELLFEKETGVAPQHVLFY